jgi:seryl-tRNA synthetase
MIDIKKIRDDVEAYKKVCLLKNKKVDVDGLIKIDDQRKDLQKRIDELKFQQKKLGEEKKYDEAKALKTEIQKLEEEYKVVVETFDKQMLTMPNIISPEVPVGKDDSENVVVKTVGEPPKFSFEPQDHMSLMKKHDMVDSERGVKLAGARSYFLKNDGMLLEQAVLQYALQKLVKK